MLAEDNPTSLAPGQDHCYNQQHLGRMSSVVLSSNWIAEYHFDGTNQLLIYQINS